MKRFTALVCAVISVMAMSALLMGCASPSNADNGGADQGDSETSDTGTGTDDADDEGGQTEEVDYSTGTHHAQMILEGYEDEPIEIEIYSDSAPVTSSTFAELVEEGYYDGKTMYWILDDMYVRLGNTEQDNDYLITGEYEESDVKNSNSLKKGVAALNRAEDGQQSDASSFIIFLSDMSYLDGKYAAFAEVTEGMSLITHIADLADSDTDEPERIETDKNGRISDEEDCPVISSIAMVD